MLWGSIAVHTLTSLGAVLALLAMQAVIASNWEMVFVWLGVALIVDGIDGPIARAVGVELQLPRFSGERIDLVVDYLTYVFVPVLALLQAGRLPAAAEMALAAAMLLSSLYHFSDIASKTEDKAFVGFPALWNIAAFYIFALDLGTTSAGVVVVLAVALTFVPLHWVHPVRVEFLRPITLAVTGLWAIAAVRAVAAGFPAEPVVVASLVGGAIYGVVLSLWLSRG
ncbi:MAG: CDP-alcohol phosphatidyltransferase family protein [Hyphomicrobiaceae bacterium]